MTADRIPPMELDKAKAWADQELHKVAGTLMRREAIEALMTQQWLLGCCMKHHHHLKAAGPQGMHSALYAHYCKRTHRNLSRESAYRLAVRAAAESIDRYRARCLALMAMLDD